MELDPYQCPPKTGKESFHVNGESIGQNILSFWQWSSSDLLGNALRGVLAEYIVSLDAHCSTEMRDVWDGYDLETTGRDRYHRYRWARTKAVGQIRGTVTLSLCGLELSKLSL